MTEHPGDLSYRPPDAMSRAGGAWFSLTNEQGNPIAAILELRQSLDEKSYLELMEQWQRNIQRLEGP